MSDCSHDVFGAGGLFADALPSYEPPEGQVALPKMRVTRPFERIGRFLDPRGAWALSHATCDLELATTEAAHGV